jgi:hydroxyquinol 1,2-dioxygenase
MRDFSEQSVTQAIVEQLGSTPDPRLRTILISLVQHLHGFVREVGLTTEEWNAAIGYLTRTGKSCDGRRQEFILLSDVLGVSILVDAINHRHCRGATESTVLGPFYVQNPPEFPHGHDLARGLPGVPLFIEGSVSSTKGIPVPGTAVDIWQADNEGFYDVQRPECSEPCLRGRFRTSASGRFCLWSVMPCSYPLPTDGPVGELLRACARPAHRPAHVHFMIRAEGYEHLITHIFVDDDKYLDTDPVLAVKNSLVRKFTHQQPGSAPDGRIMEGTWRKLSYDFVLQPARVETLPNANHELTLTPH